MSEIQQVISGADQYSQFLRIPDEMENGFVFTWTGLTGKTIISVEWKRPGESESNVIRGHQITVDNDGSEGIRYGRIPGSWDIRAGARAGDFDSQAFTVALISNAPSDQR